MNRSLVRDIIHILTYMQAMGIKKIPIVVPERLLMGDITKETRLNELKKQLQQCQKCKLSQTRTNVVFGEGSAVARLMFIGEAPGEEEDLQGRPFVGRAGELLNRLIKRMGLERESLYIANVVKCRPPGNRRPTEKEIQMCLPYLKEQIAIINPLVIITLGDVATKALLPETKSITSARGRAYKYNGIHVIPTFHPSYLLRNPSRKTLTWYDAQLALKLLKQSSDTS